MSKVLLVGCGHMGSALADAWLEFKSYSITIVDPFNYKNLKKIYYKKKIQLLNETPNQKQILNFDIIIFAVKPQVSKKVIKEYSDFNLKKNVMIGSIIAGKKINFYNSAFKKSIQIVRIMPNMPALIRRGITCFVSNRHLNDSNKKKINELFLKVGKTVWFKDENQIDIATAISGSGPGYVFTIIDAFEKSSQKMGLSKKISRELVLSTLLGSVKLMEATKKEPDVLANSISVKGGTTEAGIRVLKKNNLNKTIYNTLKAAYEKATRLGKSND